MIKYKHQIPSQGNWTGRCTIGFIQSSYSPFVKRPFTGCFEPLYESEAKLKVFVMKIRIAFFPLYESKAKMKAFITKIRIVFFHMQTKLIFI